MKYEILYEKDLTALWFDSVDEINYYRKTLFLQKFGSLEGCFYATEKELEAAAEGDLTMDVIHRWVKNRDRDVLESRYERLMDENITITYPERGDYPKKLLQIFDPPYVLYMRGKFPKEANEPGKTLGVVGSRTPDTYGREIASYFSRELAGAGYILVSGLARGIDGISHREALNANAPTIGVLGCGINVVYPHSNYRLYEDMVRGGTIISEYGPDLAPLAWRFPARNRIISGLSDGVLCVQAKKGSGSLITTNFAIEQNRQVYAVPARAYDLNYEGTNALIKGGACCVTCPEDIMRDLQPQQEEKDIVQDDGKTKSAAPVKEKPRALLKRKQISPEEKKVLSFLNLEPCYIDDLIAHTGFGITKTISTLYLMEEKGLVKQVKRGWYIVADFTRGVTYR